MITSVANAIKEICENMPGDQWEILNESTRLQIARHIIEAIEREKMTNEDLIQIREHLVKSQDKIGDLIKSQDKIEEQFEKIHRALNEIRTLIKRNGT